MPHETMTINFKNPVYYCKESNELVLLTEDCNPQKIEGNWQFSVAEVEFSDGIAGNFEIIEQDGNFLIYKHEATSGEFLISSLLLIVIGFLFIDLVLQRIIPRFMRFWK